MNKKIAVLAGDGIGPEVVAEAIKVLDAVGKTYNHTFTYTYLPVGGDAIDTEGVPLSDTTLEEIQKNDAVLLGAVGGPKWESVAVEIRPEAGLLKLRKELGLFANLRPIEVYKSLVDKSPIKSEIVEGTNILFVRELTSGIYFGTPRERQDGGDTAVDTSRYTKQEVIDVAHIAFQHARQRNKKVTSVDKANVLETSRLWRETVTALHEEQYADIELEHMYVDNASMQIIKRPTAFDVVLTENMFGDILTDEASVLAGSIGLSPSASIGKKNISMYEPIHGSSPKHAGQNKANPIGTILSVAWMLRLSFQMDKEAKAVEDAVQNVLANGARTYDIAGTGENSMTTTQMGDIIADTIK